MDPGNGYWSAIWVYYGRGGFSTATAGSYYYNSDVGVATSWTTLTATILSNCLGGGAVTNFIPDDTVLGGTLASDAYMGFSFDYAGTHYEYAMVGATATQWVANTSPADATPPIVTGVSSSTTNGTYKAGETISVQVTFSEAVTVTGTPQLTLETGTTDQVLNYSTGSGSAVLSFTYTVQAGDTSADLDYASTTALALNSGTIKDGAGNNATLTLPTPSASGSLGASKSIVVDAVRPIVTVAVADTSLAAGETSLVTFTFSEPVTGFTNGDVTIANGTLSDVSSSDGGTVYTATLTPTAALTDATNVITVAMTGVTDAAGNAGSGTTDSNNYAIDTAGPTVTVVVADTSLAAGETSLVTFTFSEPVTGFTNGDVTIANGTLSDVSSSDGGTVYTATLTPTAALTDATNVITVAMTGVTDAAGNAGSGTTDSNNYAINTATPATEFAAKSDAIRQTLTDTATTGLTSSLYANQAMLQDAKGRFVAGDTPDMALDVNGSLIANPVSVSSMGTFFGQTTQGNGTRQVVFGSFDVQRDDTSGASTATFSGKVAWEREVSKTTLLGYFIGGDLGQSNIAGSFTGDQDHLGVTAGGYGVHEMAKQLYLDGFVSVGAGRNNLTMADSVLALESDYTTRSATFGMSVSGVIGPQGYEIWPELALTVGRTWIDTVGFTGTAYGTTDNTLSLDAGMVTLANLTFRPEFHLPLDGMEVAKSLRLITLAPRLICQQTTTTTTAQTCGSGAELGLKTHSADGSTTGAAQIASDWIDGQTRTSGQLSVEMRF